MLCVDLDAGASGGSSGQGDGDALGGRVGSGDGDGDASGGMSGDGDGDASGGTQGDGDGDGSGGHLAEGGAGGGGSCEDETVSVYILSNRSTSMFQLGPWEPLKEAALDAVAQYEDDYQFGFGTFTGVQGACAGLEHRIDLGLTRYSEIEAAYEGIVDPETKIESPLALAITQLMDDLADVPGERYILLLSDDSGDFCDDGAQECATDAAVAALQLAAASGIKTIVSSITPSLDRSLDELEYMAQAGWGDAPAWDTGLDLTPYGGQIDAACRNAGHELWGDLRAANGNEPKAIECGSNLPDEGNTACYLPAGRYDEQGGSAEAVVADTPEALSSALIERLSDLAPCK